MDDFARWPLDDPPPAAIGETKSTSACGTLPELAVIIPTLNERENVAILVERLTAALSTIRWEAVFVDDDSPDGTAEAVRALALRHRDIRCLQRVGRRGLASACIEGAQSTSAPYVAVMDADLQHDERLLPQMLALLKQRRLDVVVASRYTAAAGLGDWQRSRVLISSFAGRLGRLVVKAALTDPMSGFFVIEREALAATVPRLSGQGFKILVDIFASSPRPLAFAELPLRFRCRVHGESKLDARVGMEYLALLLTKLCGCAVPTRLLLFAMVGGIGLLTQLAMLRLALGPFGIAFPAGQAIATGVAMTGNFLLNNVFTYRDRRLRGRALARGLFGFYAVCGIGAAANVAFAAHLFAAHCAWWLASAGGVLFSTLWNYAMASTLVWRRQRRAATAPRLAISAMLPRVTPTPSALDWAAD
ncbi:MAG TPA: glycosyltransferase family 2 protein [Stellaceae bacterium]|jgi:dolichol-phosphate mannosyltransferase